MSIVLVMIAAGIVIFFVVPQLVKLHATLGTGDQLGSGALSFFEKIKLRLFGLKTPILNTLAMAWSFMLTESDSIAGVAWEKIISAEHAAWVAMGLWGISLWSHFNGLNTAAETPPVTPSVLLPEGP